jgi:hypothetical protein
MARAYKTVFTVTVYSPEPIHPYMDFAGVVAEMDEGAFVGDVKQTDGPEIVEGETLIAELIAIGNDGSFFGGEDDEVEPRCDICGRLEDDPPFSLADDVDWNGETGNHVTCERNQEAANANL